MKLVVLGKLEEGNAYHDEVRAAASDEVVFPGRDLRRRTSCARCASTPAPIMHGHTVGGTNPSLVEALWAGNAVIAHDNVYNRWTAGAAALHFRRRRRAATAAIARVIADDELVGAAVRRGARARRGRSAGATCLRAYERECLALGRAAASARRRGRCGGAAMDLISRRAALAGAAATLGAALAPAAAPRRCSCGAASTRFPGSSSRRNIRRRAATTPGRRSSRRGRSRRARDLAPLRAAGFDFLRLPVDPGPFLAAPAGAAAGAARSTEGGGRGAAAPRASASSSTCRPTPATHYWTPERMTGATSAPEFPAYLALVGEIAAPAAALRARRWSRSTNPIGACARRRRAPCATALLAPRAAGRAGADARRLRRLRQPHPGARRLRSRRRSRASRRCSTPSTSTSPICSRIRARPGWASGSITR